ncbi:MAG: nucleoside hydrolase [Cyanobacteria bacterium P01_D01_bin.105]
MAKGIIVDCDPGVDDAIALLLAFGAELPILGITTVAGNVPLRLTANNARKICALADKSDIPVHAGCPRPLLRPLATAEEIHGATGLQGADLPKPTAPLQAAHSVDYLTQQLLEADEPLTIAALGPLTNIAVALIQRPELAERIDQLVLMGGSVGQGNITPSAEFNMYVDPHAAQIVLSSNIPTVLITLDTTHQVLTTPERLATIKAIGNPVSDAAAGMLSFYGQPDLERYALPGAPLHDPCVMAYLLEPELFTTRRVQVAVETSGEHTMGRTVVDWHGGSSESINQASARQASYIQVVDTVNVDGFYRLLGRALSNFS